MSELTPFQWSIKLDNGEIYVVQTNTAEELGIAIEEIRNKFLRGLPISQTPIVVANNVPTPKPGIICQVCGAKAEIREGISKAGKPYKIFRCTAQPEITPNGHSKWLRD